MLHLDTMTTPPGKMAGGESSPVSAETTFRELDEVSLQRQTKIWLSEVLQTRLNEDKNISEMLSDGELLFEVSRVIWEMVLTRRMEHGNLKPFMYDPFASRKRSGRYTPYCNVDSFLKVCKILGLSGIDLFSPSDVVEQKNTRKVCICIRLLSMKARSKCLNVPDFDVVTRSASMPTDMVNFIRRSLELSQGSSSDSASYKSPHSVSTTKTRQRHLLATSADSLSSEDINDSDINDIVQSESSSVCLKDTSYEEYPQDSPIPCKHSDAKCSGENGCEQLELIGQSVCEEEFWDSTTPDQSFITGSCASKPCSFKTSQMTVSENGHGGEPRDEYLELSSVSSASSAVCPLRLDFHDKDDTTTSETELPEELDDVAELRGDDGVTWSVQSDEDEVLLTEANPSSALDSEQTSELKRNDGSQSPSSVLKVSSSQVPSESEKPHLLQSEVAKCNVDSAEPESRTGTAGSESMPGDQFGHAPDIDNVTCGVGSNIQSDMVSVDDSNSVRKQEAIRLCNDAGVIKQHDVDGCDGNTRHGSFVPLLRTNEYSIGSDHRLEEPASDKDENDESVKPGKSDETITRRPDSEPAEVKPQKKRQMIKSIVRGTAVLSVMFIMLQFRKSGIGKVKALRGKDDQTQSTKTWSFPAQRSKGVEI